MLSERDFSRFLARKNAADSAARKGPLRGLKDSAFVRSRMPQNLLVFYAPPPPW
jgi:hypothetical protein